jgi:oligosaccharide repeat unit polymerase
MVHDELSIGILIISFASILLSYTLVRRASGIVRIPFISTFFMVKYFVFAYAGSVLLNVFYFTYELNTGVYNRPDILLTMWYYTTSGLFLIPLGMFVANWATGYSPMATTFQVLSKDVEISNDDKSNFMFFLLLILFSISFLVLLIYISKVGKLPILAILDGLDASDLALLRSDSNANFDGKMYRYVMFTKTLPLLLLFIVFFMKNISFKWKFFFYVLLAFNMFTSIMDLQKAPILKIFLLLMLAYFYSNNKISRKVFISTGLILSGLIMMMYVFFMGMSDRSFFDILGAPLHRIFIGQIEPFYYYQLFQEEYGYIYGASFPNPAEIFPFEHRKITVEVKNFTEPHLFKLGIVGSSPTVFFVDWFINFGLYMALFSMILFGFMIQMIDIYFLSKLAKYKSLLLSVLFIFLINFFGDFSGTSYVGILFETKWVFPVFVVVSLEIIRQIFKIFIRRIYEK